jgi:hypothetical protein
MHEMNVQAAWGSVMRCRVTLVIALAAMLGASGGAGCSPGGIRISSTITAESAAPIERLLVLADIKSPVFGDAMYGGFHNGVTAALAMCHVDGRLLHRDPMELDEEERVVRAMKELQPGARLLIKSTGGTLDGSTPSMRSFRLELLDLASNKVTWQADVMMWDAHHDDRDNGEDLAVHVISRLRADGLLRSCPSGELSTSSCWERRRGTLAMSKRIADRQARARVAKAAPICR